MAVGPDLRFLDQAVESVLAQEYADLELVIVDDATGRSEVFEEISRRDPRILVLTNHENVGAAASANRGIAASRGDIVARLDADDVAERAHVGRLVAALDADAGLGLVGSAVTLIDEADQEHGVRPMPESDLEIRWTILFHSPFFHSAVAYRRDLFDEVGGYREDELISQDHYLWHALLEVTRAANLAEPLTRYRINTRGLTAGGEAHDPRGRTHAIREAEWSRLGLTYDLYDDHPAGEISALLRGEGIPAVGSRMAAYRTALTALDALLRDSRRRAPIRDRAERRQLAERLMAAMVAEPPARADRRRRLHALCRSVDRRAASAAGTDRLLDPAYLPATGAAPLPEWAPWYAGKQLTTDWTTPSLPPWYAVLGPRRDEPLDILEIGSWEGRSAIFFLRFFWHSRLTCVDTFMGSAEHQQREDWARELPYVEERFRANVAEFGDRVRVVKASSAEALPRLRDEGATYDLVFVDGDHASDAVLHDAELSWSLVGPGGVIVFDDYDWVFHEDPSLTPRAGVDEFLARHPGEYRELHRGYQLFIQRV
jgi:methyltransferase family protein/glycosyl transferase family 2